MIYTVTFNPSIDYVVRMDKEINFGMTNRSASEEYFIGGKGNNVSFVLKELGLDSIAIGFAAGFTGDAIVKGLTDRGIKSDYIVLPEGNSRINIKLKGSNKVETEINANGPVIDDASLNKFFYIIDKLTDGDIIVLAGSISKGLPTTIYEEILDRLSSKNVSSIVDASGDLLRNILKHHPFLIKPNKQELEEFFDVKLDTLADILKYAKALQEEGARNVLVSLGEEGAFLLTEEGKTYYSPAIPGNISNTVGAGDSMVAGFIYGYEKFRDFETALKFGSAAGSATAFSDDLCKGEEVFALYEGIESKDYKY